VDTPRPSPRTNRTRRVPHPVLIGHAASLSQAEAARPRRRAGGRCARPAGALARSGAAGERDARPPTCAAAASPPPLAIRPRGVCVALPSAGRKLSAAAVRVAGRGRCGVKLYQEGKALQSAPAPLTLYNPLLPLCWQDGPASPPPRARGSLDLARGGAPAGKPLSRIERSITGDFAAPFSERQRFSEPRRVSERQRAFLPVRTQSCRL